MLAIKKARKLIEANPNSEASKTLAALVVALETEASFPLNSIYTLGDKPFQLALDILAEWRLDRHYAKKMRLMDVINQAQQKPESADAPAPTDTPATAA
jgi:hypothetical protein